MGEAEVYIDGVKLSDAEVMTLRNAISAMVIRLKAEGLGEDEVGKEICAGYIHHGNRIEAMLVEGGNRPDRLAARQRAFK